MWRSRRRSKREAQLSDREDIIDMKQNADGSWSPADEDPAVSGMDPFKEYVHKSERTEKKPQREFREKRQTRPRTKSRPMPRVVVLNDPVVERYKRREKAFKNVDEFFEGAETIARFFDVVSKRVERIVQGEDDVGSSDTISGSSERSDRRRGEETRGRSGSD